MLGGQGSETPGDKEIQALKTIKRFSGRALGATLALVLACAIGAAIVASVSPGLVRTAQAAVQNFGPSVPVYAMPILMPGAYTTTITPVKFKMPYASRLVGFSGVGRTLSGTFTIDLQVAGASVLASPLTLSTSVSDAVISTAAVADEAEVTLVLTVSGTSPTGSDITAMPIFVR